MKKILVFFTALVLMFCFTSSVSAANSITSRLKGKLLLQVQDKGRIWYVNPSDSQKYQVTFANALNLFQRFALGITNADLIKIPADLESISSSQDSDGDGYTDRAELQSGFSPYIAGAGAGKFSLDNNLAKRLKGKLLLQVQQGGAIWYVDINGIRHNVRWNNLMDLFRRLALGITDKDLETVGNVETVNWQTYTNSEYGYEVKYPKGWFVYDDACECMCENSPSSKVDSFNRIRIQSFKRSDECGYSGLGGKGIQIGIDITDKLKNLDDWINAMKTIDPTMKVNIIKDINIGGIAGKELTLSCDCLIGVDFYRVIEKNNMIYEFSILTQDVNLNNYQPTINQILSTFKFTDETANWQTYQSSRYGYKLKYPQNWYNLPNFGAPDSDKYFSNENVSAVMEMSGSGIWLTVTGMGHGGLTAEEWANKKASDNGFLVESKKYITLSGESAVDQIENLGTGMGGEGGYQRVVYVVNPETGKLFALKFLVLDNKSLLNSNIVNSIINSFNL